MFDLETEAGGMFAEFVENGDHNAVCVKNLLEAGFSANYIGIPLRFLRILMIQL